MKPFPSRRGRFGTVVAAATAVAMLGLSACGGGSGDAGGDAASNDVNLVGFAVIKSAYDALSEAYEDTDAGQDLSFKGSYGASGAQSRAVLAGQKADVVVFSVLPDLTALVDAGKVAKDWNTGPGEGFVSHSVVVLAVRKGNPKGIKGWDDIVKPGVGIVTADPGTSGAAKWNLLGAYAQAAGPKDADPKAGEEYLGKFVNNVVSWNDSGRTATDAFVKGTGDVLISYENEAIAARAAGVELDYIVPDSSFLIENPGAVTTTASPAAKGFLDFVKSADGQKILGSKGFRPVDESPVTGVEGANDPANPFPTIGTLATVEDLGGWSDINKRFFDKDAGLVTELRK